MIEVKNLTKNYNPDFSALLNLSFVVDKKPLAVIGYNCAGKTTLLNILAGLDNNYSGDVIINGVNRRDLKNEENIISYIMDPVVLFENKSVYDNLKYVYKVSGETDKEKINKEIKAVAEELHLFGVLTKKVRKCNYFEKLLVCVGRILIKKPKIIMVDEPLKDLLNFEKRSLLQTLVSVASKLSSDLIVAEYGQNLAYFNDFEILKLDFGTKVE